MAGRSESTSEDAIDALYGLPREQFTKSRNELARELRSQGEGDAADRVRALQKPTPAAWAVNQLMRTQPTDARALLDAGTRLRNAHEAVATGKGSGADLRSAAEAERDAVAKLSRAARGLVSESGRGLSETMLDRVAQTLHAISSDRDIRSLAEAGRLSQGRQAIGTGTLLGASPNKGTRNSPETAGPSRAELAKARKRLQRAQQTARQLGSARTRAARATADAEGALARAREKERVAVERQEANEAEIKELRRELERLQ